MLRTLGLIVATALISTTATAKVTDSKIRWCDGCSAEQEKDMVRNFTGENGTFEYYIGNLQAQTLHKYQLARGWDEPPCTGLPGVDPNCQVPWSHSKPASGTPVSPQQKIITYVYDEPVEGDIAEAFENAMNFYYTEPLGWRKLYEVQLIDPSTPSSASYKRYYRDGKFVPQNKPLDTIGPLQTTPVVDFPDPNATVYDVVVVGAKQNQFLDYFLQPGNQQFKVASTYLLKVLSYVKLFDADKLPANVIAVKFADGSQITITLDSRTTSPRYVIDEKSARDSHGNVVPVRQEQIQGVRSEYSFGGAGNESDRPNMWHQLHGLGADMGGVPIEVPRYFCGPYRDGAGVTCYLSN